MVRSCGHPGLLPGSPGGGLGQALWQRVPGLATVEAEHGLKPGSGGTMLSVGVYRMPQVPGRRAFTEPVLTSFTKYYLIYTSQHPLTKVLELSLSLFKAHAG